MATDYIFPTAAQLREIAATKMPELVRSRPIFDYFPREDQDTDVIIWEQEDVLTGLQSYRGLNGAPPNVARPGAKRYVEQPAVFGEFTLIDEVELTRRRSYGSLTAMISINDLVTRAQDFLMGRELDRQEKMLWDLVTTGTVSVTGVNGTTAYSIAYTTQTYDATTWGTVNTATPLADFRAVQLKARGYSLRFDQGAAAYANIPTINKMLSNTNANDIAGRRTAGLGSINSIDQVNQLLLMDGLPRIIPYDAGYLDDSATFQPFIPDNKVIVFGARTDGAALGAYFMTRNANNPGLAPGAYTKVVDGGDDGVPRTIAVHRGHNGGPALMFPSGIVVMDVS